jgi:hypothetical protein
MKLSVRYHCYRVRVTVTERSDDVIDVATGDRTRAIGLDDNARADVERRLMLPCACRAYPHPEHRRIQVFYVDQDIGRVNDRMTFFAVTTI